MLRLKSLAIVFLFVAVLAPRAWATHGSVAAGFSHSGPITTISAPTLPKGVFSLEVIFEYQKFDNFTAEELLGFADSGLEDIHNVDYLLSTSLGIAYGITDELSFHLRIPNISRSDIAEAEEGAIEALGDSQGIGDLTVLAHYQFLREQDRGFEAALQLGIKAPTGDTGETDAEGNVFDAEFQPGSGSWDPIIGVAVTKGVGKVYLDASFLYILATEGTQDTDLGDALAYNAAVSYRAYEGDASLDLILEANGIWRDREEIGGVEDPNSGGTLIFVSPGLRLSAGHHTTAYFSIGFPVVEDLNGEQNEVDYRAVFGVGLGF